MGTTLSKSNSSSTELRRSWALLCLGITPGEETPEVAFNSDIVSHVLHAPIARRPADFSGPVLEDTAVEHGCPLGPLGLPLPLPLPADFSWTCTDDSTTSRHTFMGCQLRSPDAQWRGEEVLPGSGADPHEDTQRMFACSPNELPARQSTPASRGATPMMLAGSPGRGTPARRGVIPMLAGSPDRRTPSSRGAADSYVAIRRSPSGTAFVANGGTDEDSSRNRLPTKSPY